MNTYGTRLAAYLPQCLALFLAAQAAGQVANEPSPSAGNFQVKVNVVLVPVVVRDAQGRAVGNLKKEDFEVFDQGKRQVISGFTIQKRSPGEIADRAIPPPSSSANAAVPGAGAPASMPQEVAAKKFVVFLFDDLHLSFADLAQVQTSANRILASSLVNSDLAAVVSTSGVHTTATADRARLQEAISKLRAGERQTGGQCPNVDYYLADLILNRRDDAAYEAAVEETLICDHSHFSTPAERTVAEKVAGQKVEAAASQALSIGDQDAQVTLGLLEGVVTRLGALPGERRVILISPGFLATSPEAMNLKSQIVDAAARSSVTVSTLDARGMYTTELGASQRTDASARSLATGQASQYHRDSMRVNEGVMAEIADGTGGAYFHNSNDLEGGFRSLTAVPEYLYLLEVSPKKIKPNGSYHQLRVKVNARGLTLQARQGYFAAKPEKGRMAPAVAASAPGPSAGPAILPAERQPVQSGSSQKSSVSESRPMPSEPARALSPQASPGPPPEGKPAAPPPADLSTYPHYSMRRLKTAVPALSGLKLDPDQDRINPILSRMGQTIAELLPKLPNLISREEVHRLRSGVDPNALIELTPLDAETRLLQSPSQEFRYLILSHRSAGGNPMIEEFRTDRKGRPIESSSLSVAPDAQGFAYRWLLFSSRNQPECHFRYLGTQNIDGRKTFVLAFAQIPDRVTGPAIFEAGQQRIPFFYQGILWVDQANADIVLLRTDLLAPIPSVQLERMTTELHFRSVHIEELAATFWLPRELRVEIEQGRSNTEEIHRYSGYHLYHATSRIVPSP